MLLTEAEILVSYTSIYGLSYTPSSDRFCPKGTGGFTRKVSGRGVNVTVLLVVPRLEMPGAVLPIPRALLSTNNFTFI
jgi:hypothetical protein